jgi:hypothetical protein
LVVVDIAAVASAIGQVASAAFAVPVAVLAYFSWKTSRSATKANELLTEIETKRLHSELRPEFEVAWTQPKDVADGISVRFALIGPRSLEYLDGLAIEVRSVFGPQRDSEDGGATHDHFKYVFSVDQFPFDELPDSATFTRTDYFPFSLGDDRTFYMKPPRNADLYLVADIRPVQFLMHCQLNGYDDWTVPLSMPIRHGDAKGAI